MSRESGESLAGMLRTIRRVLADGVVTEDEAVALATWVGEHPEVVERWPGKVLAHRLERIFSDGRVEEKEREDLQRLLRSLAAGDWGIRFAEGGAGGIPVTHPPPVLVFPEQRFVFVGEFAYGSREACEAAVTRLGGRCQREVTEEADVVVVGTFGAKDWRHSPEAGRIDEALRLREAGGGMAVVAEDYWAAHLPGA